MRYQQGKTEITMYESDFKNLKRSGVIRRGSIIVFFEEGEQRESRRDDKNPPKDKKKGK